MNVMDTTTLRAKVSERQFIHRAVELSAINPRGTQTGCYARLEIGEP